MSLLFNSNKLNCNIISSSYEKIKINNLFLNNKFIIFINLDYNILFKNIFLNNKVHSLILKEKYIKLLFEIPNFSFLRNNLLCIFINHSKIFINIIQLLEKKQFFYSYKNCLSNMIINSIIIEEYNKYNMNFIYIQLILKKIKLKIIILLLFFLISIIKYIKK